MDDVDSDASPAGLGKPMQLLLHSRVRSFYREYQWAMIGGLWLIAYVLGCVGAAKQFAATGENRSPSEPYYRALQLFIMDDGMITNGPLASWQLEVARFLAPAVAAYAAVAAFVAIFRDQLRMFRLRFSRQHVVICGLGRKGLALACDFKRRGDRVVVIERDETNKAIATCRELGIITLIADATEMPTRTALGDWLRNIPPIVAGSSEGIPARSMSS